MGHVRGYLPNRWPSWFDPVPLDLATKAVGPFAASKPLIDAGDVVAVATPGHTADHLSVLVQDEGTTFLLAADTSYDERLMLAGRIDGVSANDGLAGATLGGIRQLARGR
jgi:N-acyl homoserine lactone hydrolase